MSLNGGSSETPTFTEEAVTFCGSAGNLFRTAKPQLLGHNFICVTVRFYCLQGPRCATALPAKAWLHMAAWLSLNPADNGEKEGAPFPFQPSSGMPVLCRCLPTSQPAELPAESTCSVICASGLQCFSEFAESL